jgi:hypothetical protein
MPSRRFSTVAACVAALVVVSLMALLFHSALGGPASGVGNETPQQRFEHLGGLQLLVELSCPQDAPKCDVSQNVPAVASILQHRLADGLGRSDIIVQQYKQSYISLQLPDIKEDIHVLALLKPGQMTVIDTGAKSLPVGTDVASLVCPIHTYCAPKPGQPALYQTVFTGAQIDPNTVNLNTGVQSGQPSVTFAFVGEAKGAFGDYTRQHIGQYMTFALDGTVIESATIQSAITGSVQITGLPSPQDARVLATLLKTGLLPLSLTLVSEAYIAPHSQHGGSPCVPATPYIVSTPGAATPTPMPASASSGVSPTPVPTPGMGVPPTPGSGSGAATCATPTPGFGEPTPAAVDGGNIPGPKSRYFPIGVTSTGVDGTLNPVSVTSHFPAGEPVYVVVQVRGLPKGQRHIVSIRWFFQGVDLQPAGLVSKTVTKDSNVAFSLAFPSAGAGMAKVYLDMPAGDVRDDPGDPALAQTLTFSIEPHGPAPTPTP